MRFLLLNRFFGNQQTPTARMLRDVATELQKLGHEVTTIASKSAYGPHNSAHESSTPGVRVRHVRELGAGRILLWSSYWIQAALALARTDWDRCLLLTDPPFLPFAGSLTRKLRRPGQRLYWWTMDLYPEALVASGRMREESFLYRRLRSLNELGLRDLHGIIALGAMQIRRFESYRNWGLVKDCSVVVPPWDLRQIGCVSPEANRILHRYKWHGKKLALYAGNLGEGHLCANFVEAARIMQSEARTDWAFVFFVRGSQRSRLDRAVTGLQNFSVLDYLPEDETPDLLSAATVHLISMKPGWEGVIVPSKLYGVLQTGSPVLFVGPLDSDTAVELDRTGRGLSLSPQTTGEALCRALDTLAQPVWFQRTPLSSSGPQRVAEFVCSDS